MSALSTLLTDTLRVMKTLGSSRSRGALAIMLVMVVSRAEATVTQVDGTILPAGTGMQAALTQYEPTNTPNAIRDASEFPQIFRPRTDQPVVFLDIRDDAGFENSFGWYNVGDDVQTAAGRQANLHPVLGCGVPMNATGNNNTHRGNTAYYVVNANEGGQASVDFAQEQRDLRYKGGFIGFYLITPEDPTNPGRSLPNRAIPCGDFKNDGGNPSRSLFGRIYFTQKDLNQDGDFVHHLVWQSQTANRFFFGFEDLFRGGDNDFDDMAIRADGLTPPCTPSAEICDGIDNNCDGQIDNSPTDIGASCQCNGVGMTCTNGPRTGQCLPGVTVCSSGQLACQGTGTPSSELCDGLDNNCNGQIDDAPTDSTINQPCDGQDADRCNEGQMVCQNGAIVCNDNTGPNIEVCNGVDDDCMNGVDDGDPGGGASCGSSIGVCTPGVEHCVGGEVQCVGGAQPSPEQCNRLDDDCNGVADNNPAGTGASCGTTNVGECQLGTRVCSDGALTCAGEIGPSTERCNNRDDDCDGTIDNDPADAGQACGESRGACEPGVFVCSSGTLVCTGGVGPTPEVCNGIDDDCNGIVDDNPSGMGGSCDPGTGRCGTGILRCIAGAPACVGGSTTGTEICNGMDDNCNGEIDEGPSICGTGACNNGACTTPCLDSEFPCPNGTICNEENNCVADPCANVTCGNDANGNLTTCQEGACVPLCSTYDCPTNLVCRGRDGACVLDTCDYLPKCGANEICVNSACAPNPCTGVSCDSGTFCRGGSCVASCDGVTCRSNETCSDGVCVPTGCPASCGSGVCNPETHLCQANRCGFVQCPDTKECDPLSGQCVASACEGVTCPDGQTCKFGQCGKSIRNSIVTAGGAGGCSAGGNGSLGSLVMFAGLALVGRMWRSRRSRALVGRTLRAALPKLSVVAAVALSLAGCKMNDYCLDCEVPGDGRGSGGSGGDDDDDDGPIGGCDPNAIRSEACNGLDDDCNGEIDEVFNLDNDPANCGACGNSCAKPGAQTRCVAGACVFAGCFPNYVDTNGDTSGPFESSNGCEYNCFVSNQGQEVCDSLDNNCNGQADETFDKLNDTDNCGQCGRTCEFFGATARCVLGTCQFNRATDCAPGFVDRDGAQENGCEYQCTRSNNGVEVCDVLDNDCDGAVDEGFDPMTDAANCGHCGVTCSFPHATPMCTAGACQFNPATGCEPNFHDIDGEQLNGCEYECTPSNNGDEACDGQDNDCDGRADENAIGVGELCAASDPPAGICENTGRMICANGSLRCDGAPQPLAESCNNLDDDCDGTVDDNLRQTCYTGPNGTVGIGICHSGEATCSAGSFGTCIGEQKPNPEVCNGFDDDCDASVDEAPGGGVISETCYSGGPGTAGVGTCRTGTRTCRFGSFGTCAGEVVPTAFDTCGDPAGDTDCNGLGDAQEGCLTVATNSDSRIDTGNAQHSYDVVIARGGNPLGTNVYVAWSQLVPAVQGGNPQQTEVMFLRSFNGGRTWQGVGAQTAPRNVTNATVGNKVKPILAVAPGATATTDRVVLVYQTVSGGVRDIVTQISTDSGATFGGVSGALDVDGDSFHHTVAISSGTCVIAWESLNTSNQNRDIRSRTSSDGCSTMSSEFTVNVIPNNGTGARFAGRPQVGIATGNRITWVWREPRGANTTRDIFAASSSGLLAPTTDVKIDGDSGTGSRESDFPQLVINGDNAYVVWQDVSTTGGGADVMYARSVNGGASWGPEAALDNSGTTVTPSFTPVLAVDPRGAGNADDVVAVAWEDRRQGSQIFAAVSTDGGAAFTAPGRVTSVSGGPATGQMSVPQITAAGDGVLAVAYQNQLGTARPHVFIATSVNNGGTWTYSVSRLDRAGAVGPALAPQVIGTRIDGDPAALAAWADFRLDSNAINGDIWVALARPAP